ncbi:MAG: NIPSNAP family containing protein, partial [Acidobacteria bacterium]
SEIAIFRRTGLQPIFFGDTLIGTRQPQLTYMLVFESPEARERNWGQFIADPEWKKLSTTPGYTDAETVTSITNVLLRPAAYSQI